MVEEHQAFKNIPSVFNYMVCSFRKKSMLNALKMCVGKKAKLSLHDVKSSVEGSVHTVLYCLNCSRIPNILLFWFNYVQDQLFLLRLETKFWRHCWFTEKFMWNHLLSWKPWNFSWEEVLTVWGLSLDNYWLIENLQEAGKNSSDTTFKDLLLLFSLLLTTPTIRKQAVENESFYFQTFFFNGLPGVYLQWKICIYKLLYRTFLSKDHGNCRYWAQQTICYLCKFYICTCIWMCILL